MASTPFDALKNQWLAGNRYTAAADTDILLTCTSGDMVRWSITTDDNPPSISVGQAHVLTEHDRIPMTLKADERLWIAGHGATATLET